MQLSIAGTRGPVLMPQWPKPYDGVGCAAGGVEVTVTRPIGLSRGA